MASLGNMLAMLDPGERSFRRRRAVQEEQAEAVGGLLGQQEQSFPVYMDGLRSDVVTQEGSGLLRALQGQPQARREGLQEFAAGLAQIPGYTGAGINMLTEAESQQTQEEQAAIERQAQAAENLLDRAAQEERQRMADRAAMQRVEAQQAGAMARTEAQQVGAMDRTRAQIDANVESARRAAANGATGLPPVDPKSGTMLQLNKHGQPVLSHLLGSKQNLEWQEQLEALGGVIDAFGDFEAMYSDVGPEFLNTSDLATMRNMRERVLARVAEATNKGVLQEAERAALEDLLPDPGDDFYRAFPGRFWAGYAVWQNQAQAEYDAILDITRLTMSPGFDRFYPPVKKPGEQ